MSVLRFLLPAVAGLTLLAASGCKDHAAPVSPSPTLSLSPTPRLATSADASIELVSANVVTPTSAETRDGLDFAQLDIHVNVEGMKLDATSVGADLPGIGTWWAFIDDKLAGVSMSESLSAPNDMVPVIARGSHTVRVQLRDNRGAPLVPDASVSMDIVVDRDLQYRADQGPPSIRLIQATKDSATQLRVVVGGVHMDGAKLYEPGATGFAEWRLFIDDIYVGLSVTDVMSLPTDLMDASANGIRTLKFQLYSTSGTPLEPAVIETKQLLLSLQ